MLRQIQRADLKRMVAIENAVHIAPWSEETFLICFQEAYRGWVVEIDKTVIGFIILSLHDDECHILNLCVDRPYQRQGWGKQLLKQAINNAKQQGAGIAYLEVRRSNTRAIALYKNEGFLLVGERQGYYPIVNGHEDALVFAKNLCE